MSLSVCVSEPEDVDLEVFSLWLDGCGADEAARQKARSEPEVTRLFKDCACSLLRAEVEEQFRLFQILRPYLQHPQTLVSQELVQLSHACKLMLIERSKHKQIASP